MGREVRRVPLDFDAPIDQVWRGFLNPHWKDSRECPFCGGSGYNAETNAISDDWYDFAGTGRRWCGAITQDEVDALVEAGRLREWRGHGKGGWVTVPRTAAEVNAANQRGSGMLGDLAHDGLNRSICIETRAKRLGVWGGCDTCDENGRVWSSPEAEAAYHAWTETPVPTGDGYQLWTTTTEGSPMTPVFATPEQLARHCADEGVSTFGYSTTTYENWLSFIRGPGWALSMVGDASGLHSGVDFAAESTK